MNFNINPERTATSNEKEKNSNNNYDIVSLCDTLSTLKTNEKQCHAKETQRRNDDGLIFHIIKKKKLQQQRVSFYFLCLPISFVFDLIHFFSAPSLACYVVNSVFTKNLKQLTFL